MIDLEAHAPIIAVVATSLAAKFDGIVEDGELAFLEGAEAFVGVAIAALDDVAHFGTLIVDGESVALYAVDAAAKIAQPSATESASSSPPEGLNAGGTARTPEAGENVLGGTEEESGADAAAPDSPPDLTWLTGDQARAVLLEQILDLTIEHPSGLWRGFRQGYFNRARVTRLVDLDVGVLEQCARDAQVFVSQIPSTQKRPARRPGGTQ